MPTAGQSSRSFGPMITALSWHDLCRSSLFFVGQGVRHHDPAGGLRWPYYFLPTETPPSPLRVAGPLSRTELARRTEGPLHASGRVVIPSDRFCCHSGGMGPNAFPGRRSPRLKLVHGWRKFPLTSWRPRQRGHEEAGEDDAGGSSPGPCATAPGLGRRLSHPDELGRSPRRRAWFAAPTFTASPPPPPPPRHEQAPSGSGHSASARRFYLHRVNPPPATREGPHNGPSTNESAARLLGPVVLPGDATRPTCSRCDAEACERVTGHRPAKCIVFSFVRPQSTQLL